MSLKATYCLVGQICDKSWHAAANTITKHTELYPKVLNSVNRKCQSTYMMISESMLCNKPDEISRFSHSSASFLSSSFKNYLVLGACSIHDSL